MPPTASPVPSPHESRVQLETRRLSEKFQDTPIAPQTENSPLKQEEEKVRIDDVVLEIETSPLKEPPLSERAPVEANKIDLVSKDFTPKEQSQK